MFFRFFIVRSARGGGGGVEGVCVCVCGIRGTMVVHWTAAQQVQRSILHQGHGSYQIHLISPGCPRPERKRERGSGREKEIDR